MIKLTHKEIDFELYNDICTMPILSYNSFIENTIFRNDIGCKIEDLGYHFSRMAMFAKNDKKDYYLQQRKNLNICIINILRGINFDITSAFSADKKDILDIDDMYNSLNIDMNRNTDSAMTMLVEANEIMSTIDNHSSTWNVLGMVDNMAKALSELSVFLLKKRCYNEYVYSEIDYLDRYTKLLNSQLIVYHPKMFGNSQILNYWTMVLNRTRAELKSIVSPSEIEDNIIRQIDNYIVDTMKPLNLSGFDAENEVVKRRKSFEKICAMMMKMGIDNPKNLSVVSFYTSIEQLKNRQK